MPDSREYVFGPYAVDPARRVVTRNRRPLAVTARAFDVLLVLLEHAGETVEKDALLSLVWPDMIVEEANLSQQIFTIRKLLNHEDEPPCIVTVPRRGYRFVAPVTKRGIVLPTGARAASVPQPIEHAQLAIPIDPAIPLSTGPSAVVAISSDGSRIVFCPRGRRNTAAVPLGAKPTDPNLAWPQHVAGG